MYIYGYGMIPKSIYLSNSALEKPEECMKSVQS